MGGYSNVDCMSRIRRKRRRSASVSELWLVPLMERYYEPRKPAIVAVGLVLLPICIRFVLPSIEISRFVMVPLKESLPEVCNVMHTWLTPSMLFVLLNLVIGTIAVTSSRGPPPMAIIIRTLAICIGLHLINMDKILWTEF